VVQPEAPAVPPMPAYDPAEDPFARAEADDADWLNRGAL
jgi:hypothetical protein